jgi:outer membrane receptor for ferrienterochelin and colicins
MLTSKFLKRILVCSLLVISLKSYAQPNCGTATINEVSLKYEIGRFRECIARLNECLTNNGFTVNEKIEAYRLLAMCHLAIDSVKDAGSDISQLLFLKDNFEPNSRDPERFKIEVNRIKSLSRVSIVSSVSKRDEELRLAPATISVITKEEIVERGYNDLIDILKDIPGFDISVYYGVLYANIYQRGLRTNNTEKTLIMIDGVEDNDLWTNYADISQQYPISNVKRVEVIYGPASTMYGANAFTGVINIITKEPEDYLQKNRSFGISANTGVGSYNTKFLDMSVAYKKGQVSFSLTGRAYMSDRPNLSSQNFFDYNPAAYDNVNYSNLLSIRSNAQQYINANSLPLTSNNYKVYGAPGAADSIILTAAGDQLARTFDKNAYNQVVRNKAVNQFINKATSEYVHAKLNIGDFSLGFVQWAKTEGAGTLYTDQFAAVSGTQWKPSHQYAYLNYEKRINNNLTIYSLSNYKIHTINNGAQVTNVNNYARKSFDLKDLERNIAPVWATTYYYEQSEQFRTEFKMVYNWNKYLYLISGVELRNSQLQGNYLTSSSPNPQDSGIAVGFTQGGNQFDVNDLGIYSQGGYRTKNGFGVTLGVRMDKNTIRKYGGFGTEFSPRFVVDYSTKTFVIKAIYSRGIVNVSNFTKFSAAANRIPNPNLGTESINNYEVSLNKQFSKTFSADIDFYFSTIQNVVGTVAISSALLQNQNIGRFKIFGIQSNLNYATGNFKATLNYSFASPKQTKSEKGDVDLTVADIANHHVNAIFNYLLAKHVNINFRTNYVGAKSAGLNTTVPTNLNTFDGYTISNLTLGMVNVLKNATVQVVINNIFDKNYYSPGVRLADGINNPSQILQMGRNFMARINFDF